MVLDLKVERVHRNLSGANIQVRTITHTHTHNQDPIIVEGGESGSKGEGLVLDLVGDNRGLIGGHYVVVLGEDKGGG